jgi:monoamine oxidase
MTKHRDQAPPARPAPQFRKLSLALNMVAGDPRTGGLTNLIPRYLDILAAFRLPAARMDAERPSKVMIIGAGITGLLTAILLRGAGHEVTILEANKNRAGGRIKTFRGTRIRRAATNWQSPGSPDSPRTVGVHRLRWRPAVKSRTDDDWHAN